MRDLKNVAKVIGWLSVHVAIALATVVAHRASEVLR